MMPDQYTNQELMLDVGNGHQIYVHDWGQKDAKTPILFLHGGPGNGTFDSDKDKFDPKTQRVIFHDQRGSGKSTPTGSLQNNTSQHLVEDIEKIAQKLSLDKFILVGGSWGSTLSLLYGIAHPERVVGMVIDGVYTASDTENDWLEKGGWSTFFPDIWQEYQATVPKDYRSNPSEYHFEHAFSDDPETAKKSSYAYLSMELALLKLDQRYTPDPYDKFEPGGGTIEIHYLKNSCFLDDNFILDNASQLTMPVFIVQGRYDMICPPQTAYNLSMALPNSNLIWTINGHSKQHEAKNILNLLLKQLSKET
jgi:proline iminopeptidase